MAKTQSGKKKVYVGPSKDGRNKAHYRSTPRVIDSKYRYEE